jgi:HD-GYP domain-containing protein (c-di-GMP phosphodiesterase class II)
MTYNFLSEKTVDWFNEITAEKAIKPYLEFLASRLPDTYQHSIRVSQLCIDIGLEQRLDEDIVYRLGMAALLHDIGKTEIPAEILNKQGPLVKEEYRIVKEHTRFSVIGIQDLHDPLVQWIIAAHHEFGAAPYPRNGVDRRHAERVKFDRRKQKPGIRFASQILAATDMLDSLAQSRAYKPAFPKSEIERLLHQDFKGDPGLIELALKRIN